jgi:hypothetical protein
MEPALRRLIDVTCHGALPVAVVAYSLPLHTGELI